MVTSTRAAYNCVHELHSVTQNFHRNFFHWNFVHQPEIQVDCIPISDSATPFSSNLLIFKIPVWLYRRCIDTIKFPDKPTLMKRESMCIDLFTSISILRGDAQSIRWGGVGLNA
jgi:hypothetical protein